MTPGLVRLERKITRGTGGLLARLFGLGSIRTPSPDQARDLRDAVEQRVYRGQALEDYERGNPPELERLARRSLAQYLATRELDVNRLARAAHEVLGLVALPAITGILAGRALRTRRPTPPPSGAVFVGDPYRNEVKVAERLAAAHGTSVMIVPIPSGRLDRHVLRRLGAILRADWRIATRPFLVLHLLLWLARFHELASDRNPTMVVSQFEDSAAASSVTGMLRDRGIRHVNLMHGLRFETPACAFAEFDEFAVWSHRFQELFETFHARAGQWRIVGHDENEELLGCRRSHPVRPRRLTIVCNGYVTGALKSGLLDAMKHTVDESWEVVVRPHPLTGDGGTASLVEQALGRPAGTSTGPLVDEARSSAIAIGATSTALVQLWLAGVKVVAVASGTPMSFWERTFDGSPNVLLIEGAPVEAEALRRFLEEPPDLSDEDLRRARSSGMVAEKDDSASSDRGAVPHAPPECPPSTTT